MEQDSASPPMPRCVIFAASIEQTRLIWFEMAIKPREREAADA
jgi:hypothetical protein